MRKKPMKRLLAMVLAVVCVVGLTSTACAIDQPPVNSATSACVMDVDSGRILYSKNENAERCIASITKIIYHSVAQQLNSEGGNVERNMRYAVHRAWDKCDKAVLARYFGEARAQDKEPPSNREFCAALVEYLRQEACRL